MRLLGTVPLGCVLLVAFIRLWSTGSPPWLGSTLPSPPLHCTHSPALLHYPTLSPQGQNFAYLQIKTIWSVLLRNFDFELLDPVPEPNYTSMVCTPGLCGARRELPRGVHPPR